MQRINFVLNFPHNKNEKNAKKRILFFTIIDPRKDILRLYIFIL